nr:sigma-70 family RNA polymerase sigma factor [uncultured Oscillibacter sp.]
MKNTRYEGSFDTRASEWIGDMTVWTREHAADNSERLERLRRNLRRAREQELTPRQRQLLELYYDQGMNIPQIAGELGVNRSTVSRTLRRARDRLYRCLRYAL